VLARFAATALNHLLAQNSWALPRLQKFAGKTARFTIAPFSFGYTILEDGLLRNADAATSADAHCAIAPTLLPRLAVHDENALGEIKREGDAALLTEIFFLSKNLRWDAAEDLSKVTGDMLAERVVQAGRTARQQLHNATDNLARAAIEYWTEERPLLATPPRMATFMQQVDALRDDLARLEQRIKRLGNS
jgi:ubiquinone biosynthesis protein UbiJ